MRGPRTLPLAFVIVAVLLVVWPTLVRPHLSPGTATLYLFVVWALIIVGLFLWSRWTARSHEPDGKPDDRGDTPDE